MDFNFIVVLLLYTVYEVHVKKQCRMNIVPVALPQLWLRILPYCMYDCVVTHKVVQ